MEGLPRGWAQARAAARLDAPAGAGLPLTLRACTTQVRRWCARAGAPRWAAAMAGWATEEARIGVGRRGVSGAAAGRQSETVRGESWGAMQCSDRRNEGAATLPRSQGAPPQQAQQAPDQMEMTARLPTLAAPLGWPATGRRMEGTQGALGGRRAAAGGGQRRRRRLPAVPSWTAHAVLLLARWLQAARRRRWTAQVRERCFRDRGVML